MHDKVERFLFKGVAEPIMVIVQASKNVAEAAYALVLIVESQKGKIAASLFAFSFLPGLPRSGAHLFRT